MTPRLPASVLLWYVTAVGSIAIVPFLAPVLSDAGLSDRAVALSLFLMPVGMLLGGPVWAWVADRTGAAHTVLRGATALSAAAAILLLATVHPLLMALSLLLMSLGKAPQSAIGDAITVDLLGTDRRSYGGIRAWGSLAFLLTALVGGAVREEALRGPLLLPTVLLVGAAVVAWRLPRRDVPTPTGILVSPRRILLHPVLLPLALTGFLHGMAITAYDNWIGLHVERLGFSPIVTGLALAFGVAVEIVVMLFGRRLLDGVGSAPVIVLGVAAGVPRWWLTGTAPDAATLVLVQGLHGLTFGAYWIAGVTLCAERAPQGLASSTQALLPASTFGAGYLASMGLATLVIEPLGTSGFYRLLAGVSVAATAMALVVAWQDRRVPLEEG